MKNYYQILGLPSSATAQEIRRAYRILARRYHPDVNPGKGSEDKFKDIAEAYETLSDNKKRRDFDLQHEDSERESVNAKVRAYQREQSRARARFDKAEEQFRAAQTRARQSGTAQTASEINAADPANVTSFGLGDAWRLTKNMMGDLKQAWSETRRQEKSERSNGTPSSVTRVSIIEASVSMRDAIFGVKKAVEIPEPEGLRKVSVRIPAGVRNGSVIRLRPKGPTREELILIVRVASHPFLSIQTKGLVLDVPVTVNEALQGASITVPTLEDPVVVRVPPGTQSGSEVRLKGKGIMLKDGQRGDFFLRFMIRVPDSAQAVGLKDKAQELEPYYESQVRQSLPKTLLQNL